MQPLLKWTFLTIAASAILLSLTGTARAVPIVVEYGTGGSVFIRDCSVGVGCNDADPNLGFSPIISSSSANGANQVVSTVATSHPLATGSGGEQSFFTASLEGGFGLPTLRGAAYSTTPGRVSAGGVSLQQYQWDGTGPTTRTFGATLTYSQSGSWPEDGSGAVVARIAAYSLPSGTDLILDTEGACSLALISISSSSCFSGATLLGFHEIGTDAGPVFDGSVTVPSLTVTLDASSTLYFAAALTTFGRLGGFSDSSSTLLTFIDDQSGLSPTGTPHAVPEPPSLPLLLAGLIAIAWSRKRKFASCHAFGLGPT